MKNKRISANTRRTHNRRARELKGLLKQSENLFHRRWNKLVDDWLDLIRDCQRDWQRGKELQTDTNQNGKIEESQTHIFDVVELAENQLRVCGKEIQALVGDKTIKLLTDECSRAVSRVCDGRLAGNQVQRWYRWA